METIIQILTACASPIIVGVVLGVWNRKQNKRVTEDEEKENRTVQKEVLELNLLLASAQLTYAVAMAVKRGTPNGEMETAIKRYEKAMEKFQLFEREGLVRLD